MKKLISLLLTLFCCFGACTTSTKDSTTGKAVIQPGGSFVVACQNTGGAQPAPTSLGGLTSTGGRSSSTGGTPGKATGGTIGTGGSVPVVVVFPPCNSNEEHLSRTAHYGKRPLGGKKLKPRGAKITAPQAVTGPSAMHYGTCAALDQGQIGSCTGNDATQTSSTLPYTQPCTKATETAALQCYEDATNIDNSCAWNATCGACPAAFCPATSANDNGSSGASAFQAATDLGWFPKGTRSVTQTLQGWHDALIPGPCGFDQPWYNIGFTPTQCGEVLLTGGLAGYHSTEAVGYDVANQRLWLRNSWGIFGVDDGYFYYSYADQQALLAAGATMTCPMLPASNDNGITYKQMVRQPLLGGAG